MGIPRTRVTFPLVAEKMMLSMDWSPNLGDGHREASDVMRQEFKCRPVERGHGLIPTATSGACRVDTWTFPRGVVAFLR